MPSNKKYGWVPSRPDGRDILFSVSEPLILPSMVDLRELCPPVYDQGELGSCTANAIAGAIQFDLIKQSLPDFMPSRLFIYLNERVMEDTVQSDAGAQIRDGIKSVVQSGVCSEDSWPYDISKFAEKPPQNCYDEALKSLVKLYQLIPDGNLQLIKQSLAKGFPVVGGFTVYESFESTDVAGSGIVNMPRPDERSVGGHAILIVGYDDNSSRFIIRNSWGLSWGQKGYFTLPFDYLTMMDDFWVINAL